MGGTISSYRFANRGTPLPSSVRMKTFTLQRGWRMPSSTTLELILNGTVNASFCRFSRLAPTQTRDQLADAIDIARQIGLIPAALAGRLLQPLQRHAGGAADDERNLGILRSARQRQIALVHDDGGEPRRREADRHGIGLAEKLDLAAALIHHAQAAGPETDT
ncbi:hypothetical protein G6F68_014363 [Rhizopus microsporus]|nr:hypothetical protein G6F68_014363 [Rhizopus microsporus]